MKRLVLLLAVLAAFGVIFAGSACASTYGTISAGLLSVSPNQTVTFHVFDPTAGHWDYESTLAGVFNLRREDTPGVNGANAFIPTDFSTHCIDLAQYIYWYPSVNTYTVKDITDAPNPTGLSGGSISAAKADLLQRLFMTNWSYQGQTGGAGQWAAARQLAVWEIVFEQGSTYDVKKGATGTYYTFYADGVSTNTLDAADQMLGTAVAYQWQPLDIKPPVYALVSATYQDQLYAIVGGTLLPPIPEPLTMLGMFLGLGGVGAYIKRRLL
jgi:hypothetical protein